MNFLEKVQLLLSNFVYLQRLKTVFILTKILKQVILILFVAFVPSIAGATEGPSTECPKKDKGKSDSLEVVEKNEIIPAQQFEQKLGIGQEDFITNNPVIVNQHDASEEVVNEDASSALSFNIVYYIFEKFKFSSSVDPQ